MGSYNYLGFAENNADFLKTVADATCQYGVGVCSTRQEMGEFVVIVQLYREKTCVVLKSSFNKGNLFILTKKSPLHNSN